jgi:hypothetical protein
MTLKAALFNHQLDVAAMEISAPLKQLQNLEVWMKKVDMPEREDADLLIKVTRQLALRQKVDPVDAIESKRIMERAECQIK